MQRKCPDCGIEMIKEVVEGVTIYACPSCAGVWVHPESLKEVLTRNQAGLLEIEDKNVPTAQHKLDGATNRNCPDCSGPLEHYHYCYNSPVMLQVCMLCGGFWIEDGQLKQMQDWLNSRNQPMTQDEQDRMETAMYTAEHEEYMVRQHHVKTLFNCFGRYYPGWLGKQ